MSLTPYERETIINYNQKEKTANIYTHDPVLIRKLHKLIENGEAITTISEDNECGEYTIPRSAVKVRFPKQLTEEKRQELSDRMKVARAKGRI